MEENRKIRELVYTNEFREYYNSLNERARNKFSESFALLEKMLVLNTKLVKVLKNTDVHLYELRVSVGYNEHRSILFAADHDNIIQSTKIVVLNGFMKKSSNNYRKYINRAINILNRIDYDKEFRSGKSGETS